MNLVSWNVLHRTVEERYNPDSLILKKYENENDRISDILLHLSMCIDNKSIIALQECSDELLRQLVRMFKNHKIFVKKRSDDEDFIVSIVPKMYDCQVEEINLDIEGNYLIVSNNHFRIVNCHLHPYRLLKNKTQSMYNFNRLDKAKTNIILGDFNDRYNGLKRMLGCRFTIPFYGKTYKQKGIDFIIFDKNFKYSSGMIKNDLISDHNLIKLKLIKS